MTGTEWQNYTAPSGGPAANDTLLELDVSDTSANAAGTVHQDTIAHVVQAGLGLTTQGDLAVGGSSGVPQRLAAGTSGYVLTAHGAGALPTWAAASGGTSLSGVTVVAPSGTDDTSAINAALAAGGACQLGQATYKISAPITPTSGSALIGVQGGWSSVSDAYGPDNDGNAAGSPTGTMIQVLSSFAGEAAILLDNETTNSLTIGPLLRDFYVDCSAMQVQTANWSVSGNPYNGNGIAVYGAVVAGQIEHVTVSKAQGSCFVLDSAQGGTGAGYPDNWVIRDCKASSARANEFAGTGNYPGHGFVIPRCPDVVVSGCEGSENYGDGWNLFDVTNGMFTHCKGENNGLNGWHFIGAFGAQYLQNFIGCTSNFNGENGFLWDETGGGSGPADWNMVGCKASDDGQNGAGYAGFAVSVSPDRIMLTGCFVDGSTQQYGISITGPSFGVIVTGGSFVGTASGFSALHTVVTGGAITHTPTTSTGPGTINTY